MDVKLTGTEASDGSDAGPTVITDIGKLAQARTRTLAAVSSLDPVAAAADVNEAFWDAGLSVSQLVVSGATVSGTVTYVKAVFNVLPDETKATQRLTAKAMLAVTNSSATDVQWKMIKLDRDFTRRFAKTPLRNAFFQAVGSTPIAALNLEAS